MNKVKLPDPFKQQGYSWEFSIHEDPPNNMEYMLTGTHPTQDTMKFDLDRFSLIKDNKINLKVVQKFIRGWIHRHRHDWILNGFDSHAQHAPEWAKAHALGEIASQLKELNQHLAYWSNVGKKEYAESQAEREESDG